MILFSPSFSPSSISILSRSDISLYIPGTFAFKCGEMLDDNRYLLTIFLGKSKVVCGEGNIVKRVRYLKTDHLSGNNVKILAIAIKGKYVIMCTKLSFSDILLIIL